MPDWAKPGNRTNRLAPKAVEGVIQLLKHGRSVRTVMTLTDLSETTVRRIKSGARTPHQTEFETQAAPCFDGPHIRCPTCGGMQQMPCFVCKTRRDIAIQRQEASHVR